MAMCVVEYTQRYETKTSAEVKALCTCLVVCKTCNSYLISGAECLLVLYCLKTKYSSKHQVFRDPCPRRTYVSLLFLPNT